MYYIYVYINSYFYIYEFVRIFIYFRKTWSYLAFLLIDF